jgi:hypothetical protein
MTFVTLGGEGSLTTRSHPRALKVVVSRGKVCDTSPPKENKQELVK